jgi:ATP-binding protein involved in chromosome partitioning
LNKDTIETALKGVKYPGFSRDIVSFGLLRNIDIENQNVIVNLEVNTADPKLPLNLKKAVEDALGAIDAIGKIEVRINVKAATSPASPASPADKNSGQLGVKNQLQNVERIVAIASGKGGVGKSTFTVNLACALNDTLSALGKSNKVGIMDCDIYGPSIPLMIGINGRPEIEDNNLQPLENFGIRVMSMGFLIDEDTPVVWRGPMVTKTITQFVSNVNWGELEFLLVDLPPGTGDAQLTIVQTMPLDGAIVITTPQPAAFNVARRGATMFGKVNVPILGVVENMSFLELPSSEERHYLFGKGGGEITALDLGTKLLGQIPLYEGIRVGCDNGIPLVVGEPQSSPAVAYKKIAENLINSMG